MKNVLVTGHAAAIQETSPYRWVITLLCDDTSVVFGYEVATRIRVRLADARRQ